MDDRNYPNEPDEAADQHPEPPEIGEDPGMVGREPVRKQPVDDPSRRDDPIEDPRPARERPIEDPDRLPEVPTETPIEEPNPSRRDPMDVPSAGIGLSEYADMPGRLNADERAPEGTSRREISSAEDPLYTVDAASTGRPAGRGDRTVWIVGIIALLVFCIMILAIIMGGVL